MPTDIQDSWNSQWDDMAWAFWPLWCEGELRQAQVSVRIYYIQFLQKLVSKFMFSSSLFPRRPALGDSGWLSCFCWWHCVSVDYNILLLLTSFYIYFRYNLLRKKFPATSFTGTPVLSDAGFDLLNKLLTYDPEKVSSICSFILFMWSSSPVSIVWTENGYCAEDNCWRCSQPRMVSRSPITQV